MTIRHHALRLAILALALGAPTATAQTPADRSAPTALDAPTAPSGDAARALATGTSVATVAYQGVLSDGGTPVADGSHTLTIGLYDDSSSLLYAETHTVTTVGGAFSLAIGGGSPTSGSFDDITFAGETSVRVTVGGTVLGPDTPIQAVPHARSLTAGARIIGATEGLGESVVYVENTATSVSNPGVALSVTANGIGILAEVPSGFGVWGSVSHPQGTGILGRHSADSGSGRGVSGSTDSPSGLGVYGRNGAFTGEGIGILGESASPQGTGVVGRASAPSGSTSGVYGSSSSSSGQGVHGVNLASAGENEGVGVLGESVSPEGSGVYGRVTSLSGASSGVYGLAMSTGGRGVVGQAIASNGSTIGVYGRTISPDGEGVFGFAQSSTGETIGVRGRTFSVSGRGVVGESLAGGGITYGVSGEAASKTGRGVFGNATSAIGTTYGVQGEAASTSGRGVFGNATATSGATQGVYGAVTSPDGHAGYFTGGRGLYVDAGSAGHGALVLSGGGNGASTTTVFAENASTSNGIAGWFETNGTDASLVAYQRGTGDIFRAIENQNLRFRVKANGDVTADGTFTGGGADLAEFFPLADGATASPGQVVGLTGGRVSLSTDGAEQIAVISSDPAFVGNPDAEAGGALVALVGQVSVDVSGDAAVGDLLIASGDADGRARAVSPTAYSPADGTVIGRVLTSDAGAVIALVGVDEAAALRGVVARQAEQIDALTARLARLESLLTP